ncbi:hypothetical protein AB0H34_37650 [Saccharopolyspora shandongensis]|uniref:hypothetical protein n=1 Tax=Saccharopolyspora shandongensis TaxID=418495 RepID=UPI0033F17004
MLSAHIACVYGYVNVIFYKRENVAARVREILLMPDVAEPAERAELAGKLFVHIGLSKIKIEAAPRIPSGKRRRSTETSSGQAAVSVCRSSKPEKHPRVNLPQPARSPAQIQYHHMKELHHARHRSS